MDSDVSEMARQRYGYGRWSAPYWFIGLEEGMARDGTDGLKPRAAAWRRLGGGELNDCRKFHDCLGERRWHGDKPRLQPTWRPLMKMLMTFTGRCVDNASLRDYQRNRWGTLDGETCLIELSGLAAPDLNTERDRSFVDDRIGVVRGKILQYRPTLVVMYGLTRRATWEKLTGRPFPEDNTLIDGTTIMALTKHPTSHGSTNAYWAKVGASLRERQL